jgi:hypothetical protein
MTVPEAAILQAGFILGHAAWSISDLPAGDFLVPLALVESEAGQQLFRFEADTQDEAIADGEKFVAEKKESATVWAFAREGQVDTRNGPLDVLVVDAWAAGMREPITFIQPFQPYASGTFKLLGLAVPVIEGVMLDEAASEPYLEALYRGVSNHSKASELWPSWQ